MSSHCFDSLEHVNLSVLDDLLDAGIGSAVNAGAGLTIAEKYQTRKDYNQFPRPRLEVKFRRITRPRFAIRKKLGIRLLLGYEYQAESGVIRDR